jgi:hypothetical protein
MCDRPSSPLPPSSSFPVLESGSNSSDQRRSLGLRPMAGSTLRVCPPAIDTNPVFTEVRRIAKVGCDGLIEAGASPARRCRGWRVVRSAGSNSVYRQWSMQFALTQMSCRMLPPALTVRHSGSSGPPPVRDRWVNTHAKCRMDTAHSVRQLGASPYPFAQCNSGRQPSRTATT